MKKAGRPAARKRAGQEREELRMTNLNESNVLLNTTFADSLNEGEFMVKITNHERNVVYGECIEVEIRHSEDEELYFHGTYEKEEFPGNFFEVLPNDWDYVEEKIRDFSMAWEG